MGNGHFPSTAGVKCPTGHSQHNAPLQHSLSWTPLSKAMLLLAQLRCMHMAAELCWGEAQLSQRSQAHTWNNIYTMYCYSFTPLGSHKVAKVLETGSVLGFVASLPQSPGQTVLIKAPSYPPEAISDMSDTAG